MSYTVLAAHQIAQRFLMENTIWNLEEMLKSYEHVLIPEMNNGQLIKIIRSTYLIGAEGLHKIKGVPFTATEIKRKIQSLLSV